MASSPRPSMAAPGPFHGAAGGGGVDACDVASASLGRPGRRFVPRAGLPGSRAPWVRAFSRALGLRRPSVRVARTSPFSAGGRG